MKVYIGADHRGFALKEKLKEFVFKLGYEVLDMGAYQKEKYDDYTLYAEKVASIISKEKENLGVLLCGSGVGVDVVANKFDNVRASIGKNKEQVRAGRNDDDMNVLVIAADYTTEPDAKEMVKEFLKTDFSGKARYEKRLTEIENLEKNN